MPKVGMQPIRRKQLINATIQCIYREGLLGTTVKKVSQEAGVSSGIINHYFGGKDQMLEATMREVMYRHQQAGILRLHDCRTHEDRIRMIIKINFSPLQTDPATVCTWLAFWAQAMHVPALARLQKINTRRLYSNLLYSLKHLLRPEQAVFMAEGLAALIDGLWLRGAFAEDGIDSEHAFQVVWSFYQSQLMASKAKTS
jgi:TetR/AcrR family transcriptional repressor of bet genes